MTKDSVIAELVKALTKARVYVESNARVIGTDSTLQHLADIDAALSHAHAAQSDGWREIAEADKFTHNRALICTADGIVGEAEFFEEEDGWWWSGSNPTDYIDRRVDLPRFIQPLPSPPKGCGNA